LLCRRNIKVMNVRMQEDFLVTSTEDFLVTSTAKYLSTKKRVHLVII